MCLPFCVRWYFIRNWGFLENNITLRKIRTNRLIMGIVVKLPHYLNLYRASVSHCWLNFEYFVRTAPYIFVSWTFCSFSFPLRNSESTREQIILKMVIILREYFHFVTFLSQILKNLQLDYIKWPVWCTQISIKIFCLRFKISGMRNWFLHIGM